MTGHVSSLISQKTQVNCILVPPASLHFHAISIDYKEKQQMNFKYLCVFRAILFVAIVSFSRHWSQCRICITQLLHPSAIRLPATVLTTAIGNEFLRRSMEVSSLNGSRQAKEVDHSAGFVPESRSI